MGQSVPVLSDPGTPKMFSIELYWDTYWRCPVSIESESSNMATSVSVSILEVGLTVSGISDEFIFLIWIGDAPSLGNQCGPSFNHTHTHVTVS